MNFRSIGKFLLRIFDGNFMFQAGMFQADPGKFKRSQKNKEKVEDYPLKNKSFAPIPSSSDRFARQNHYGPPSGSGFPLTSSWPGIVHHLSGPNNYALRTPHKVRLMGSRGSAPYGSWEVQQVPEKQRKGGRLSSKE